MQNEGQQGSSVDSNCEQSTFVRARRTITALLRFLPSARPPGADECPSEADIKYGGCVSGVRTHSILLCGPCGNGKTTLVDTVIRDFHNNAVHGSPHLVVATPSLAKAASMRLKRNTRQTLLRKELRKCIQRSIAAHADERDMCAVLLVLDHLECFLCHTGSQFAYTAYSNASQEGLGTHATDNDGDDVSGSFAFTNHASFISDYYSIVRDAPPLFSGEELQRMRVRRVVVVSQVSTAADAIHNFCRTRCYDQVFQLSTPNQQERFTFFSHILRRSEEEEKVPCPHKSSRSSGGGGGGGGCDGNDCGSVGKHVLPLIEALASRSGGINYRGLTEVANYLTEEVDAVVNESDSSFSGFQWTEALAAAVAQRVLCSFRNSLSISAQIYKRAGGYVDVQHTPFDKIAGMQNVKDTIQHQVVRFPIKYCAQYERHGVRPPMGVLLYGPPGTGKTMLAKALATSLNSSFIYINLSELLQSEVGESERRLSEFFQIAKEKAPSVIFMDEIQSGFGNRYQEDGHTIRGASSHDSRLVSHLLYLLDNAQLESSTARIVFVGATNVIQHLDPLLLRAGRLDIHIRVPLPDTDAREYMARETLYGKWRHWFNTSTASAKLQAALLSAFVRQSDGNSGAELNNSMNIFGLHLLQRFTPSTVSRVSLPSGSTILPTQTGQTAWTSFQASLTHLLLGDHQGETSAQGEGNEEEHDKMLTDATLSMVHKAFSITEKHEQYDSFL